VSRVQRAQTDPPEAQAGRPRRLFAELRGAPASETRAEPGPGPRWRALFSAATAREILARIVADDPLQVRAVVARRLREQAWLVDADRVHLRSLALVAHWAPRYRGEPDFDAWLARLVERALLEVVEEDAEPGVADAGAAATFGRLAATIGLAAQDLLRAAAAFNRLPIEERRACLELLIFRVPLAEVSRLQSVPAVEIARRARRGLETLLAASEPAERSERREPGDRSERREPGERRERTQDAEPGDPTP